MTETTKEKMISVKDLIDRKEQIAGRKLAKKTVFVKDLDGNIEITEPTKGQVSDMTDKKGDDGNEMLIAECVTNPRLNDPELLKVYGCVTTIDLVKKMFKPGTIASLSTEIIKLAGYGEGHVKILDEIKN